jgi:hypothetical protein
VDLYIHSPIRLSCGVVNNNNIEDITTNKEHEDLGRTDSLLSSDSTRTAKKANESGEKQTNNDIIMPLAQQR